MEPTSLKLPPERLPSGPQVRDTVNMTHNPSQFCDRTPQMQDHPHVRHTSQNKFPD